MTAKTLWNKLVTSMKQGKTLIETFREIHDSNNNLIPQNQDKLASHIKERESAITSHENPPMQYISSQYITADSYTNGRQVNNFIVMGSTKNSYSFINQVKKMYRKAVFKIIIGRILKGKKIRMRVMDIRN